METRHAHGLSFPTTHRRTPSAREELSRTSAPLPAAVRFEPASAEPGGRAADLGTVPGARPGELTQAASLSERAREAHRFDRRVPALRLVGGAAEKPGAAARIMDALSASVGADRVARVFDAHVTLHVQGDQVEVRAAAKATAGLIERRFGSGLAQAAAEVLGPGVRVTYVVAPSPVAQAAPAPATPAAPAASAVPAAPRREPSTARIAGADARARAHRLEDFVVGESNRLAYSAVLQTADADHGRGGAPLFIYGPCGVGKTHLLHGLGLRFREIHPGATVRVVSGETFLNEFVAAVRHGGGSAMTGQSRSAVGPGGIERFRRQYRRCDLLCIDDVHFLASKQATQQELLHTFDQIAQSGARIVLACDQHPRQMKSGDGGFSPALVSRFLSGMVAGIDAPDAAVRERAARLFAQRRGLSLEEPALRLLVGRTQALPGQAHFSVRDLEGLLTRIEAVHRLLAGADTAPVGVLAVEKALGMSGHDRAGTGPTVRKPLRAEQIIAQTCVALGVERPDLGAATRHKRVVLARAVITHLCRELTTMSFPEIARAVGRPSHSTVITAHQRLLRQIEADEVYGIGPSGEAMTVAGLVRQLMGGFGR